jgi:hypothetical protein
MGIDPDKKVEKIQKERPGIYQSKQHPEHFENEGEEYANEPEITSSAEGIQENENAEKSKGAG